MNFVPGFSLALTTAALVPALVPALLTTAAAAPALKLELEGIARPVWMEQIPGTEQFVILQQYQAALVWDRAAGTLRETPFLDIDGELSNENEQGILSLVFAPDFAKSGHFYIYFTDENDDVIIERWQVANTEAGPVGDPASRQQILKIEQPWANHNGGWLDFGPDGNLYISAGDGGSANDPHNSGQNLGNLLGKILRIAVTGQERYAIPRDNPFVGVEGAREEIWCYGLRNAWRCSFDRRTDAFWSGDVGQNHWEEINATSFAATRGANFGWRLREGLEPTPKKNVGGDRPQGVTDPVYVYKHGGGPWEGVSVTGGYVYRGSRVPSLRGKYLFADYQNPRIWALDGEAVENPQAANPQDLTDGLQASTSTPFALISSFAEDANGELFVIDHGGRIYSLIDN